MPSRCREIPEAQDPSRIVIRQFAIVKGRAYLQQFAGPEDVRWYHSHPWSKGTVAIGLWGSVAEETMGGPTNKRLWIAPYFRYMGPEFIHRTEPLGPGHTSIFIGLGKKTDDKFYYPKLDATTKRRWQEHVKKVVKRI